MKELKRMAVEYRKVLSDIRREDIVDGERVKTNPAAIMERDMVGVDFEGGYVCGQTLSGREIRANLPQEKLKILQNMIECPDDVYYNASNFTAENWEKAVAIIATAKVMTLYGFQGSSNFIQEFQLLRKTNLTSLIQKEMELNALLREEFSNYGAGVPFEMFLKYAEKGCDFPSLKRLYKRFKPEVAESEALKALQHI